MKTRRIKTDPPVSDTLENLARAIQTLNPSITDSEALAHAKFLFLDRALREKERKVNKIVGIIIALVLLMFGIIILAKNLNQF